MKRRHVVHVLTVADSLIFIDTLVQQTLAAGHDVTVITSPDARLDDFGRRLGVRTIAVDMPRRVSPFGDWRSAAKLTELFRRLAPDVVHAGTPKGGLLGMLAASAAGVPVRIFHMRGLPSSTAKGVLRGVLETTERVSCRAASRVICQSHSLRAEAIERQLVEASHAEVVLEGSNGVDANGRFSPERHLAAGAALRARFGMSEREVVFGFVGRLVRDKGLPELVAAFEQLEARGVPARLLVAGPFEPRDPVPADVRRALETHPRISLVGEVRDPAPVYAASDVVVLPSHREGFPNVPLEAAAMQKPVITTRVPGCIDSVEDGVTGSLVNVNDPRPLADAMERYASDRNLRESHGRAGRARVERAFSRERIAQALLALYARELARV